MTLAELRAWIRRQVREVVSSEVSDAQLDQLINEGYQDFAARTACLIRDVSVNVAANATLVTFPDYVFDFRNIIQGSSRLLSATPEDMILRYGANWRSQTGTPVYYIRLSPTTVRPVPTPSAAQTWTVEACVIPSSTSGAPVALLSADSDTPAIPASYHIALAYYAVMQLALMNPQNQLLTARARQYWANYLELVEQAKRELGDILRGVTPKPLAQVQSEGQG